MQHVTGDARNISFDVSLGRGVGSTCTLVAESFLKHAPAALDPDVALLLLGKSLQGRTNCCYSNGAPVLPQTLSVVDISLTGVACPITATPSF